MCMFLDECWVLLVSYMYKALNLSISAVLTGALSVYEPLHVISNNVAF